jgi:hypothetical protein
MLGCYFWSGGGARCLIYRHHYRERVRVRQSGTWYLIPVCGPPIPARYPGTPLFTIPPCPDPVSSQSSMYSFPQSTSELRLSSGCIYSLHPIAVSLHHRIPRESGRPLKLAPPGNVPYLWSVMITWYAGALRWYLLFIPRYCALLQSS